MPDAITPEQNEADAIEQSHLDIPVTSDDEDIRGLRTSGEGHIKGARPEK